MQYLIILRYFNKQSAVFRIRYKILNNNSEMDFQIWICNFFQRVDTLRSYNKKSKIVHLVDKEGESKEGIFKIQTILI